MQRPSIRSTAHEPMECNLKEWRMGKGVHRCWGCGDRYTDLADYMLKCREFRQGRDRVAGTLREIWGNEKWGQWAGRSEELQVVEWLGLRVGLKRYAQTTIRYDTRYGAHDTICSAIHLPFLAGKQRLVIPACDQKHRTLPTTTACAVMMRNGYNNGGLLRVSGCSVFVMNLLVLLEYTGCCLQYFVFVSNFGMCYNCIVSYLPQSVSQYVP